MSSSPKFGSPVPGHELFPELCSVESTQPKANFTAEVLLAVKEWAEKNFGPNFTRPSAEVNFSFSRLDQGVISLEKVTDQDHAAIESELAFRYFLHLFGPSKSGLAKFFAQEFAAARGDPHSAQIERASFLWWYQFPEDEGPNAHAVEPRAHTDPGERGSATISLKGAELFRLLSRRIGWKSFCEELSQFFLKHRGGTATNADFIAHLEGSTGISLTEFYEAWFKQAGTPTVVVEEKFVEGRYIVRFSQSSPVLPFQILGKKLPRPIPLRATLYSRAGKELSRKEFLLKGATEEWATEAREQPVLTLFENFSSPYKIQIQPSIDDLYLLLKSEPSPYAKWEANKALVVKLLLEAKESFRARQAPPSLARYCVALKDLLASGIVSPAALQYFLVVPEVDTIAPASGMYCVESAHLAHLWFRDSLARENADSFARIYHSFPLPAEARFSHGSAGVTAAKMALLAFLVPSDPEFRHEAVRLVNESRNLTTKLGAAWALNDLDVPEREDMIQHLFRLWRDEPRLLSKWLSLQARSLVPGGLERLKSLTSLSEKNRAHTCDLFLNFARFNSAQFHEISGAAYAFFREQILRFDRDDPTLAIQLAAAFKRRHRLGEVRSNLIEEQLTSILAEAKASGSLKKFVMQIID